MKSLKIFLFTALIFTGVGFFSGSVIVKNRIADADYHVIIKNQTEGELIVNHKSFIDGRVYFTEEKPVSLAWRMDNRGKRNVFGSSCEHQHFESTFKQKINF